MNYNAGVLDEESTSVFRVKTLPTQGSTKRLNSLSKRELKKRKVRIDWYSQRLGKSEDLFDSQPPYYFLRKLSGPKVRIRNVKRLVTLDS